MTLNPIPLEAIAIANAHRIGPENVLAIRAEGSETRDAILNRGAVAGISRVRQNTNERVLGQRASRPSSIPIEAEPSVCRLVMDMRRIEERHQHVDIEERDHAIRFRPEVGSRLPE